MKCEVAMQMMDKYINDELSPKELAAFLAHIKTCPVCYDELETLFTITMGIRYLEEEYHESYDIPQLLKDDVKKKDRRVKRRKEFYRLLWSLFLVILIGVAAFFVTRRGELAPPIVPAPLPPAPAFSFQGF